MAIIAADVGGTKTHFAIAKTNAPDKILFEAIYPSDPSADFPTLLHTFIDASGVLGKNIKTLSLAFPGVIRDTQAQLTNLPWVIEKQTLRERFNIDNVYFMNDFQASASGISCLGNKDKTTLNSATIVDGATRVVVGAGTGLGVAWAQESKGDYTSFSTEAGHMDFAPVNRVQIQLLQYLMQRFDHVSYERLLSGAGLENIYKFIRTAARDAIGDDQQTASSVRKLPDAALNIDAPWIVQQANSGVSMAIQAVTLFVEIYGAYIGNIALIFKPAGGIYISGGMAAKMQTWMCSQHFISAYKEKGRLQTMVETTAVILVTNESIGVLGAILAAVRLSKEKS